MKSPTRAVAQFRFSTDELPPRKRLAAWREVFGRTVVNLDIEPLNGESFRSEATVCQLPGLGVLFAASSAMRNSLTRELIRDDDLSFMAAPTCNWTASQVGRNPELTPGDGVLMNNAEVGSMTLASASRFTTFRVPRGPIAALVSDLDAAVARRVPADNVALQLLTRYLASSLDTEALVTPQLQQLAVTHVYDLLAMVLGATREAGEVAGGRGMRAARLRAAKSYILEHLDRHDLSAATVAAQLGVTPRYVNMLFETEQESLAEFVLAQRLLRAYRMLTDPRLAARPIGAIAFEAGFGDLSHFNRNFRRRFGMTPSQVRAAGRRGGD